MAGEIDVAVGSHETDATEESAAGVPAGVVGLTGIGHHGEDVVLSELQLVGDIHLEAHVAVVCLSHQLAVQIDVAHIHDASEVNQQALALQAVGRREVQPVPAAPHLLERTAAETALDVGGGIVVVGLLIGGRCHPRLLYLEVVGQVDGAPMTVLIGCCGSSLHIAEVESPSEVKALHGAHLCHSLKGEEAECEKK